MSKPLAAALFDIGGVLERTPGTGWQLAWARRLRMSESELMSRLDGAVGSGATQSLSEDIVAASVASTLGIDEADARALLEDMWVDYLGSPDEELIAYVGSLRPALRTGIVSNSFAGAREREQVAYRLTDLVDDVVYSHEVGLLKPDPAIYLLACRRLDVQPSEAVFVDDVEGHVAAARDLGMHGVVHRKTAETIAAIERLREA